jgi:hypothetical protein
MHRSEEQFRYLGVLLMIYTLYGKKTIFSDGTSTSINITTQSEGTFGDFPHEGFHGTPTLGKLNEAVSGFARNYGGSSKKEGRYLHMRLFPRPELAKSALAIDKCWGNTCEEIAAATIPKGVRIAFGPIEGGSEIQICIHPDDVDKLCWAIL